MLSITGVTDCCSPNCHSEGCPIPATADPPVARTAAVVAAKMVNRLRTSIVGIAPSNEALRRPPHRISPIRATAAARIERGGRQGSSLGRLLGARAAEPEGNPGFSNHNSGYLAMHPPRSFRATKGRLSVRPKGQPERHADGAFLTLSRPQCAVLLIVDTSVRPCRRGSIRRHRNWRGATRFEARENGFFTPGNTFARNEM